VYAPGSPVGLSEHPPYGKNAGQQTVKLGSQWTAERVHNLGQSQLWGTSVILVTWGMIGVVGTTMLIRRCGTSGLEEVLRRPQLHQHAIQLWKPGRVPCDESLLEARNRPRVSFPCKPGEVLRSYVWAEAPECKRSGFRRYVGLLRLHAKTVGSANVRSGVTERLAPMESAAGSLSLTTAEIPPR
jgi:hypothetical protein